MAQQREFWIVSTKAKGLKFKVVDFDTNTKKATLLGDTGVPFQHAVDDDTMARLGYVFEQRTLEAHDEAVHSESQEG